MIVAEAITDWYRRQLRSNCIPREGQRTGVDIRHPFPPPILLFDAESILLSGRSWGLLLGGRGNLGFFFPLKCAFGHLSAQAERCERLHLIQIPTPGRDLYLHLSKLPQNSQQQNVQLHENESDSNNPIDETKIILYNINEP